MAAEKLSIEKHPLELEMEAEKTSSSSARSLELANTQTSSKERIGDLNRTRTDDTLLVEGTTRLYTPDGQLLCVPMPTADPKDPLNLPTWKKVVAVISILLFGAFSGAAETIIAALMPVFAFEYKGINPRFLYDLQGFPARPDGSVNPNPAGVIGSLRTGPPVWKIYLLSSLPVLVNGISHYFLIPLSIAVGRRPVLLISGALAWIGALWAAKSTSLNSHLGARCFMGVAAGTVESLIPLIIQDLVFINWRNRAISAIWAAQGLIVVSLGIGSPMIIAKLDSWRWLYNISAILAASTWLLVIFFVPETRRSRTSAELKGQSLIPLAPGQTRPALDEAKYGKRTFWTDMRVKVGPNDWPGCWEAMLASFRSLLFINIIYVVLIQGIFIAITIAAGQTGSPVLLTVPNSWKFQHLGFAVIPIVVACPFVWAFSGLLADKTSNWITKKRGGKREPEVHLVNLVLPLMCSIVGCILFGVGGTYIREYGWPPFVVGIGLIAFGGLSFNAIMTVYVVESFPEWAGPVIINVSSFRNILGFAFSFKVVEWVGERGYLGCFGIYAGCLALVSLGLPVMYIYGKRWREVAGRAIKKKV